MVCSKIRHGELYNAADCKTTGCKRRISLYPNPNSGSFTISWSLASAPAVLKIIDITGREVYTELITEAEGVQELNITNPLSGIYFYSLTTDQKKPINGKILIIR